MYKVTNKFKDVRKFRDHNTGKDVLVNPNEFILTKRPPKTFEVWKVEKQEKKIIKKKKVKEDDEL